MTGLLPVRRRFRHRILLGAILLLALALRLWGLDHHNVWWDEGLTSWAARLPVTRILDWTAHDVHPPLYFLITRAWWLVMGDGAWGLRFLSALAGVAAVALAYGLGSELGGRRAGLLSALFLALSAFATAWSQELRMYIWAALWAAGALWAATRYWRTESRRALIVYVLTVAAALWTLYLSVTVLLVTNLAFLVLLVARRSRRPARTGQQSLHRLALRWIAAQLAAFALFAPWLAYALPRMMSWSSAESFSTGLFIRLYATVLATGVAENIEPWLWPTLAVFGVGLVGLVALLRRGHMPAQRAGLVMLILGSVLPALMVLALTTPAARRFYVPRLAPRYFLPLAAAFYVLLGWGLSKLAQRRRLSALAGAVVVVAVSIGGQWAFLPNRTQTDQVASLVATLHAYQRGGEFVLLYPDADWPLFAARHPGPWEKVPAGMQLTGDNVGGLLQPIWDGTGEALWVVTTPKAQETDPRGLVTPWLEQHAAGKYVWTFGETSLTLYARTRERGAAAGDLAPSHIVSRGMREEGGDAELLGAYVPLRRVGVGDTLHVALYFAAPPPPDLRVLLAGPARTEAALDPLPPTTRSPYRALAHLPLTSDLPPGRYLLTVTDESGDSVSLGDITIIVRKNAAALVREEDMPNRGDVRLGDHIRLLGYDLRTDTVAPGGEVELTLYWRTDAPLDARYKVFTHLVGEVWNAEQGNFLWGQHDAEPLADQSPTTTWAPGVILEDRYRIPVAPDAPRGTYKLEIGMYGLLDGVRLPVHGAVAVDNAVIVGTVEVR